MIGQPPPMQNIRHAWVVAACLLSTGCVLSVPSKPGADNVTLTYKETDIASCTALGNVVGLADTNYVRDQRREVQNQAVELGGDTVFLAAGHDPPKGTAYRCKPPVSDEKH